MSKTSKQKPEAYISILYMLTKSFREKPTSYVLCVKRQNPVLKNAFHKTSFCLFTQAKKKCRFSPKLDVHTYNIDMYAANFCLDFFHTLNYFFCVHDL